MVAKVLSPHIALPMNSTITATGHCRMESSGHPGEEELIEYKSVNPKFHKHEKCYMLYCKCCSDAFLMQY